MLTVLQIIPNMGAGGAEQGCLDVARALVARGDVAIVATTGGARCDAVRAVGAQLVLRDVKTKNPLKIVANAVWLARFARKNGVDIIHARSRAPAWSAYLACRRAGIPFVTTFHAAYKFSNAAKRAYNAVMAKADRVIAISDFIAAHIRAAYGLSGSLRVVPRGVDLQTLNSASVSEARRAALRAVWGVAQPDRVFFCPARLSRIKGQGIVIEAFARLNNREGCVLVIAGDHQGREAYKAELDQMVERLGLKDAVRLVPHCADMAAAYSLASAVLVPSQVPEGFGRVPVEAMAMGVPVLASRLGATMETLVEGETGWLVRPDDVQAWAEAMEKALVTPSDALRRMALAGRARVEHLYSVEKMTAATLAVYDGLMAEMGR